MDKKQVTTDSPEFKAIKDATIELSAMICEYIAGKGFSVPHGLTVLAGVTIAVVETVCEVIGDDAGVMMQEYIVGLQEGWKNEKDTKSL